MWRPVEKKLRRRFRFMKWRSDLRLLISRIASWEVG